MNTIPSKTQCVTVYNVRMPVEWYQHLTAKAIAQHKTVTGLVVESVRAMASPEDEQRMALKDSISITAVRQRLLMEAHPDLPPWDIPTSRMRASTPINAVVDRKSSKEIIPRDAPRSYSITTPMSQRAYYDTKQMAIDRRIETEEMARIIYRTGYLALRHGGAVALGDSDDV